MLVLRRRKIPREGLLLPRDFAAAEDGCVALSAAEVSKKPAEVPHKAGS
jgi:hypothetical protein